jgi:Protein of unknown function (DUF2934)
MGESAVPVERASRQEEIMDDRENRIREIAYFMWEEEGRPDGQADRHWQSAKAIVESQDAERRPSKASRQAMRSLNMSPRSPP